MKKNTATELIIQEPQEFFYTKISELFNELNLEASEDATFYLVGILSKFMAAENLFKKNKDGGPTPLAIQYLEALKENGVEQKKDKLKYLGDSSLYIAGYFSESLDKKIVDVDYYIDMGGMAYLEISRTMTRDSSLFSELSNKFPQFVDLLGKFSEDMRMGSGDEVSVLRAFDLWEKTGSERVANQLLKAGISANVLKKKTSKQ